MGTFLFQDQVVMIVGATGGIGRVTAQMFAEAGAKLAVFDVSPKIKDVFAGIQKDTGIQGFADSVDISSFEDCQQAVAKVKEHLGRIDILAIIAGIVHEAYPVADMPIETWQQVMDVNLTGPFYMAKAAIPLLQEQKKGSIVTISSWWGISGHAFFSAYCASKSGVRILTQSLAGELAESNIRVNAVCPGNINTDMHRKALEVEAKQRGMSFEEIKKIEWDKIPMKRAGEPEDIANTIMFLASEESKYITGATIDVNGGVMYR